MPYQDCEHASGRVAPLSRSFFGPGEAQLPQLGEQGCLHFARSVESSPTSARQGQRARRASTIKRINIFTKLLATIRHRAVRALGSAWLSGNFVKQNKAHRSEFFVPPGHFYSPFPDFADIEERRDTVFADDVPLGIDLRERNQLRWLERIAAHCHDLPFGDDPVKGLRYYYGNDQFNFGDAAVLNGVLRSLRPTRVVEIGSGYSSALMLDVNDWFLDRSTSFTFIDPYPDRLLGLVRRRDMHAHALIELPVQMVPLAQFTELQRGDILFVDSSHVLKTGSDVNHILFEILPVLADGVIVHFHDIHYPFEYPEAWVVEEKRAWNEIYAIRAFLQYNSAFSILFFNDFMFRRHQDAVRAAMPFDRACHGGSLWLHKH